MRDHGTVFEICLTTNLQTCSVPSIAAHPFRKFLDEQVRVTLNTDDPGISNITLTHELELAAHAAFAEKSVRAELVARVAATPAVC